MYAAHKIILFDGICNLCNASVNFVIQRDTNDVFRFAALQSEIGQQYISEFNINSLDTDSIILINEDICYVKSTAALYISKSMSGGYPLLFGFIIVPKFIRNWVYDFIAKNRYKWYGKKDSCMVPSKELKRKFL